VTFRTTSGADERAERLRFERTVLPHLDAAYNLARWLLANDHDAEDLVQDSYLRAYKFFGSFRGQEPRAWLLAIVRNTCFTWLERKGAHGSAHSFDENVHGIDPARDEPAQALIEAADRELVGRAIESLAPEYREVIVLREIEGLAYKEVATVVGIPLGTVMSRLSRGRKLLQNYLGEQVNKD
jgi:RNA polymerase sigma factor (sigma-70 family)